MNRRSAGRSRRFSSFTVSEPVDLSGAFFEGNADAANVTKDGSNLIGTLNDLSGNARHVTQGTAANKPLWVDNQKGAIDGCNFATGGTASKRLLKTGLGTLFNSYEWTFACVTKCDTAPALNNFHAVMATESSTSGRGGLAMGWFTTTFTRRIQMTRISDAAAGSVNFGTSSAGTWELWVVRLRGTADGSAASAVTTRVNGADIANTGTIYTNIVDANGMIQVGTKTSTAVDHSMLWCKGWNRALNDASILSLEAAVNAVYAVY